MSTTTIYYKDVAPGAEEGARVLTSVALPFSKAELLPYGVEPPPAVSCEHNYWCLDGRRQFPHGEAVAFWSSQKSGDDGVFADPPVITCSFDQQYSSTGITLVFDRAAGEYCSAVLIQWYQGDSLKSEKEFFPDGVSFFCENKVEYYDKVVITLRKTGLPGRYAKLEHILFGLCRIFGMEELRSASITNEMSLCATELPFSTMEWTLDAPGDMDLLFQLKQPVEVKNDGKLLGVYYIDGYTRSAATVYRITCCDAIGVLDEIPFSGGAYLSGKSAKAILEEILDGDFSVAYDDNVEDTTLTGILNPSSKREAIQQVLFAWGVCASTDGGSGIRVFRLPDQAKEIDMLHTYTGVTVDTAAIVTKVSVTAHTYTASAEGAIAINGVKYDETTEVYSVENPNLTQTDKKTVVEVTEATLVSPAIGQAAAQRLYDYYLKRNTNQGRIVWSGERLGDRLTMPNAWGGLHTGHTAKMEIKLSNTVAATVSTVGE